MFKVEVIADSSGKWCSNAVVHATREAAEEAGQSLADRWMAVRQWRVVEVVPAEAPLTVAELMTLAAGAEVSK